MADKRKEFSKIYDNYVSKIYRFIFLKVSSEEVAQDLSSETFVKGWEKFQLESIDNPQAFLYRIARNLVIDHYRAKGRTQYVQIDDLPIIDPAKTIEDEVIIKSDMEQIRVKLADMKDDYQNVIIWHYLDDLPIKDVAKLMDRSEDATRVLLSRALGALRDSVKTA
jgi:RNA polymerase sigma-70 factor, ECF subfamily